MGIFSENTQEDIENKTVSTISLSSLGVIRKYMNGAVCVESSPSGDILSNELINMQDEGHYLKRVKCSCISVDSNCKSHKKFENEPPLSEQTIPKAKKKINNDIPPVKDDDNDSISSQTSSLPEDNPEDLRLSIPSLTTINTSSPDPLEKQLLDISFQNWMTKKNEEKKKIEEMQMQLKENEEQLRQKQLEQERENFKRWLTNKKKEEEMKKAEMEKLFEKQRIKEIQKMRRTKESEVRYQLWLKTKEQQELEKKLQEQMKLIQIAGDRNKRLENNEIAFREWLRSSKDKPKPIPQGRGLESLRSSASVTYINPVNWVPNIEEQQKPHTQ